MSESLVQLGIGEHPLRVDLSVHAGDPFEHHIPVYDALGVLLDLTSWVTAAQVLTVGGQELNTLTVSTDATGLTVKATPEETQGWITTWPQRYMPWRIRSHYPSGEPIFRVAGWVSLYE